MGEKGAGVASVAGVRWCAPLALACALAGCKSDLSQQLLERELRYQEDQIYHLQDELLLAHSRLERTAGENATLRRQLGVDGPAAAPAAPLRAPAPMSAPIAVPPAVRIPDAGPAPPAGGRGPPAVGPPMLEGVPPLPREGARLAPPNEPVLALPPASARAPAAEGIRTLSYQQPVALDPPPSRLAINPQQTLCIDADGDGRSEGLSLVFEPRDDAERLVSASGEVQVVAFDAAAGVDAASGEGRAIATWRIAAGEVAGRFRRTSRQRGVQLDLPWPAAPPAGDHVRIVVTLQPPAGPPLEAEATVASR